MNAIRIIAVSTAVLVVAACGHDIQTTSGKSYVERFKQDAQSAGTAKNLLALEPGPARPATPVLAGDTAKTSDTSGQPSLDELVLRAAQVEPLIRFPARIGVVKIERGEMSGPGSETADAWRQLAESMKGSIGELVPINPLLARATASAVKFPAKNFSQLDNTLALARIGAGRQHLDAMIVYQVVGGADSSETLASILDYTIVGSFLIPTHAIEAEAFAVAAIIDVRNGYHYATVTATGQDNDLAVNWSTGSARREATRSAVRDAEINLAKQVDKALSDLKAQLNRERDGRES